MGSYTTLALFAGACGLEQAGHATGRFRTVGYVEADAYAQGAIQSRIRGGQLDDAPIWDDVQTFDGRPWAGLVDCIAGGFPCQDVSFAGKRGGLKPGTRSGLWNHFARIIREVRPRVVIVENVPGLLSSRNLYCEFCRDGKGWKATEERQPVPEDYDPEVHGPLDTRPACSACGRLVDHGRERFVYGFGRVLGDLAELGYDALWGVWGAADVGAPHLRKRVFVVGWDSKRGSGAWISSLGKVSRRKNPDSHGAREKVADAERRAIRRREEHREDPRAAAEVRGEVRKQRVRPDARAGGRGGPEDVAHPEVEPERPGLRARGPRGERRRRPGDGSGTGEARDSCIFDGGLGHGPGCGCAASGDISDAVGDGRSRVGEDGNSTGPTRLRRGARGDEAAKVSNPEDRGRQVEREQEAPRIEGAPGPEPDGLRGGERRDEAAVADAEGQRFGSRPGERILHAEPDGTLRDDRPQQCREVPHSADGRDVRWDGELQADEAAGRVRRDNGAGAAPDDGREWWLAEPPVGRVVDGLAYRVDRLRLCGNGVVREQAIPAFALAAEILDRMSGA